MADLLIRAGASDASLIERVLGGSPGLRPGRIVVDAHVAASTPRIAQAARAAGVPFIVDPQTHHLQDVQHPGDPWARLPYATPAASTPADLLSRARLDKVVAEATEHQIAHGATVIIAPYVHIERHDDSWTQVQVRLWQATRRYLDLQGLRLPIIPVIALGWRLLDRPTWPEVLHPLRRSLGDLAPNEVAVAASRVDAGARPQDRLASFTAVIRRLARQFPVIAWQQGTLGEAAVAAGASGYECGIGWRERCDLRTAMGAHRHASTGGIARPVYVATLKRGVPKASVRLLLENHRIAAGLICLRTSCCPDGRRNLLEDAREHAIRARLRGLHDLTLPAQPAWRWNLLSSDATVGLKLAARINALAERTPGLHRVDLSAMNATLALAEHHRQSLRRHRAA